MAALGAAVGLQAAGATFSAVSSYYQGKWAKQLAEYNAKVATLQGKYAIERGQQTEARARIATGQMQGAQRAAYAGQNVLVDDGTALEAQTDAAKWGEIDALTIRNNAALEAWGFKQSAINSRIQGQMAYAQGVAGSIGSILGGAGQVAGTMSAAK
jgi:hypothetical protein